MTAGALAISSAAQILVWMLPVYPAASAPLDRLLVPVFALALSYFAINSWLIAIAIAFELDTSAIEIWRRHFLWLSLNYLGGAWVALILVSYSRAIDLAALEISEVHAAERESSAHGRLERRDGCWPKSPAIRLQGVGAACISPPSRIQSGRWPLNGSALNVRCSPTYRNDGRPDPPKSDKSIVAPKRWRP